MEEHRYTRLVTSPSPSSAGNDHACRAHARGRVLRSAPFSGWAPRGDRHTVRSSGPSLPWNIELVMSEPYGGAVQGHLASGDSQRTEEAGVTTVGGDGAYVASRLTAVAARAVEETVDAVDLLRRPRTGHRKTNVDESTWGDWFTSLGELSRRRVDRWRSALTVMERRRRARCAVSNKARRY